MTKILYNNQEYNVPENEIDKFISISPGAEIIEKEDKPGKTSDPVKETAVAGSETTAVVTDSNSEDTFLDSQDPSEKYKTKLKKIENNIRLIAGDDLKVDKLDSPNRIKQYVELVKEYNSILGDYKTYVNEYNDNIKKEIYQDPNIRFGIGQELQGLGIEDIRKLQPKKKEQPNIFKAAYNTFSKRFPQAIEQFNMSQAGRDMQNLFDEEERLEQNKNEDGTYNYNIKYPSPFVGRGMRTAPTFKTGTKQEALDYYENEKKFLGKKIIESYIKSDEYQQYLNEFEQAKILDENGNLSVTIKDVGQIIGEQVPQALVSTLFLGLPTYLQEAGAVAQRLLDKEGAKMLGISEEEYYSLDENSRSKAVLELIESGNADDIFKKANNVGLINAGLDLVGNFAMYGAATKLLPKSVPQAILKGKFKRALKESIPFLQVQALGTGLEIPTEMLQELNSAVATGDEFGLKEAIEIAGTTFIGAVGTQVSISGTVSTVKEAQAEIVALVNPNALRALSNDMKKKVNANADLTADQKLDLLQDIDAAEQIARDENYKYMKSDSKKNVFNNLVQLQKTNREISQLQNEINESKKNGENTLMLEAKLKRKVQGANGFNNGIRKEVRFDKYKTQGKSLAAWVNTQTKGFFGNKQVVIKETTEELRSYLEKNDPEALKQEYVQDVLNGKISGTKFGNNAYVVENNVKKNIYKGSLTSPNVIHHEVLHFITDGLSLKQKKEIMATIQEQFENTNDPELQEINAVLKERLKAYKDDTETEQINEFLTSLSDALRILELDNIEKADVFNAISDVFAKNFSLTVPNYEFKVDGENALEFIKTYNSFQGKKSIAQKIEAVGVAAADVASKIQPKTDVEEKDMASKEIVITPLGEQFINDLKDADSGITNETLVDTYLSPSTTPDAKFSITEAIVEHNWPVISSALKFTPSGPFKIENVKQAVKEQLDGIFPKTGQFSARTIPVLNNYKKPEKVTTYLSSVFGRRQAEIFERAKMMEGQILEEGVLTDIETDVQPDLDVATVKTINLAERLYNQDQLDQAKALIAQDERDPSTLSYATLGNITAPVTSQIFNVPADKFTDPKSNLTKQEVIDGRQAIIKNAKLILDTRPDGAVVEGAAVSEQLRGTSTGVARGLLNSPLFKRQERGTKGAGLAPFVRNENATIEDIINLVGKKGEPAVPRSSQAQNIKSIIKMVDGAITNSLYRSETVLTPQETTDIAAGKAQALATKEDQELSERLVGFSYNDKTKAGAKKYADDWIEMIEKYFNKYEEGILGPTMLIGTKNPQAEYLRTRFDKTKILGLRDNKKFSHTKWKKEDIFRNSEWKRAKNKKHVQNWYLIWNILDNIIQKEPKYIPSILHMLNKGVSERSHFMPVGAEFVAYHKDLKLGDKMELEHALPQANAYRLLVEESFNRELPFNKVLQSVQKNYKLIAVTKADNKQINDAGLKVKMTLEGEWDVYSDNWFDRYVNAKLNLDNYITVDGENFNDAFINTKSLASKEINLNNEFNAILEKRTGIEAFKKFGDIKGVVRGRKEKGVMNFFIPHSAEDFQGLMYALLPKGKDGDVAMEWMRQTFFKPYSRAMENMSKERAAVMNDFVALKKKLKNVPKTLKQKIGKNLDFTNQEAVRVWVWNEQKMDIPGLSNLDKSQLVSIVNQNEQLLEFAQELIKINKAEGYMKPDNNWISGTITTDLLSNLNKVKRKKHLEKWKENVNAVFTEENKNKLRAAYGDSYVQSLENILARMESGRNRTGSGDTQVDSWLDWLNNSVGAIMFLNIRSAVLQTISTVNYMNWSDNNPLKAAAAFANQPQFWKDFSMIFNSDYLKERRGGLQLNVSENEIAEMANRGGVRGAISYLLNKGFVLTRVADSFAIANGGAAFYRNRVNSYKKQGLSEKEAEEKAFIDFKELTEEAQQSSRPDRISKQQASGFGRVILAFANTPMQYARLQKRAVQDLVNRRGDWKTNMSKLIYYGVIQNFIFNALQQALFALGFDSEEEKEKEKEKYINVLNSMLDSILRGIGVVGNIAMVGKNFAIDLAKRANKPKPNFQDAAWRLLDISPPLDSKITKIRSALYTLEYEGDKMIEDGFSLDNPAAMASAQTISALTNVPLDRVMRLYDNTRAAVASDTEAWQRVALLLGWSTWELGMQKSEKLDVKKVKPRDVRKTTTKRKITKRKIR